MIKKIPRKIITRTTSQPVLNTQVCHALKRAKLPKKKISFYLHPFNVIWIVVSFYRKFGRQYK